MLADRLLRGGVSVRTAEGNDSMSRALACYWPRGVSVAITFSASFPREDG